MAETARLGLPLLAGEQAQKHVTHNEALLRLDGAVQLVLQGLDQSAVPGAPEAGAAYAIGAEGEGVFADHAGEIALTTLGGWRFVVPREGWRAWDAVLARDIVFAAGGWRSASDRLPGVGIGTEADETNRLAVRTEVALFAAIEPADGGTGNVRVTLSKEAESGSATLLFQSGFAARAEIGLAGDDALAFKVSADGVAFDTAMTLLPGGFVSVGGFAGMVPSAPVVAMGVLACETGNVAPVPESGSSATVETILGGFDGAQLIITGTDGIALTFADGVGNLSLGADRTLSAAAHSLVLMRKGSSWIALAHIGA